MEEVHKKRKADRAADLESRLQALEGKNSVPTLSRREVSPPPSLPPTATPESMSIASGQAARPGIPGMPPGMPG